MESACCWVGIIHGRHVHPATTKLAPYELLQKAYRADHLERGFLGLWIHSVAAAAENTLFGHWGGRGSGEPEMAGLALPGCG